MNAKLLQDTITFVQSVGCLDPACTGPNLRPVGKINLNSTKVTCSRCRLVARLLKAQGVYKPRALRGNLHLNLTKEA